MERDMSVECLLRNHKRPHDQISRRSSRSRSPWFANVPGPSWSAASSSTASYRPHRFRFPGDGLDHRRPIMSQPSPNVIDLTEEPDSPPLVHSRPSASSQPISNRASRPPRFPRDIINLEDEDETSGRRTNGGENGSPEVEVISSRPLLPAERLAPRPQGVGGLASFLRHNISSQVSGQSGSQESSRSLLGPTWERMRNFVTAATENRNVDPQEVREVIDREAITREQQMLLLRHVERRRANATVHQRQHDLNDDVAFLGTHPGFLPPIDLNWDRAAFQIGNGHRHQPPAPTYDPPPPARKGFTRSPREEDTAVCPNCDDELGTGEDEMKRQVWVVKSCGHVYCGECAKNRTKARAKHARAARIKTFSRCVVEGCGKQTISNSKSMFQIFL